jgi:hypothetical protein
MKSNLPESVRTDRGSSLVEFTVLVPLFLSIFSIGFSQVFETQMREQALTAFTRSLARAVELGSSLHDVAEFAGVLQADARFEHPPALRFSCLEGSKTCSVTAQYRAASHTSLIDGGGVHESLRTEFGTIGSGLIR